MKIVRFLADGQAQYGVLEGETIICPWAFCTAAAQGVHSGAVGRRYGLEDVKLLAPVEPSKVVAVGLNYRSHAEETKMPLPPVPLLFLKPSTAVIGPGESIVLPPGAGRVDHEGELGVVIGKKAQNVPREHATDYIMGYTCVNDVSERHIQKADVQWTRAKGFDTFCPVGPWVETALNPNNARLETRVNGVVRQSSTTSDLIFGVDRLVEFISGVMTLLPGDVISTGTPAGIGRINPGDVVEVTVEGIGTLRNNVVSGSH